MKNLVIIGGGFAGVTLAHKLEKTMPEDWDIYLLSKTNFITYNPLLPEIIGASILPGHVQAPYRLILKRTRIRMVCIDSVDYQNKIIHYHNDRNASLNYDQLVLACGVKANTKMVPGMEKHTLPLKTVGDALFIRNQIIERLEQATIHPDQEVRKFLTSFVILGGGFSGAETAGELEDFLTSAQKFYKNVERKDCKVTVIHSGNRLLPELTEKLSEVTYRKFKARKINILLNERAESIEQGQVNLKSGTKETGATIISTIGTTPHPFVLGSDMPSKGGKIITKHDMSIEANPGIWALGDCALVPNQQDNQYCPPTAQFAVRQAKVLAKNIVAYTQNQATQAFKYKPVGMLASIGHNKAVAEIFGMQFSGIIGFMLWRGVYILKIPTLARKVRLFLEWNWAMFFPPDIAHLGYKRSKDED